MGDETFSRKGFFKELFSVVKKGVANQIDQRMATTMDAPLRPPGALEELEFLSTCTRCGDCLTACPYKALQKRSVQSGLGANTPYIDPSLQACRLCPDLPCISACEPGALLPVAAPDQVRMGIATIDEEHCRTWDDKICTLCYDACPLPERAITINGDFHPEILSGCVGCGLCEQHCPTSPSGVVVHSHVKARGKQIEKEHYFGIFKKEDEA